MENYQLNRGDDSNDSDSQVPRAQGFTQITRKWLIHSSTERSSVPGVTLGKAAENKIIIMP